MPPDARMSRIDAYNIVWIQEDRLPLMVLDGRFQIYQSLMTLKLSVRLS